jgi:protein-tyrosine phosphatase
MHCDAVLPNLFVGPDPCIDEDFERLKTFNITAILSLQTDEDRGDKGLADESAGARRAGLAFASVPIEDFSHSDLALRLRDCVASLERLLAEGNTVYVHCTAGVSRSPTVVAAYLHWGLGWELQRAVNHLKACRRCVPDEKAILRASRGRSQSNS